MSFAAERKNLVFTAKLALQAERYAEMVDAIKQVAKLNVELTAEERRLLSIGYKNAVDARRSSRKVLSSTEQTEETERKNLVFTAKLALQAERYAEMVDAMKQVANLNVELTAKERHLLSIGYKKVVDARRLSWKVLSSTEQTEEAKDNNVYKKQLKEYKQKVESELSTFCGDIITVLDAHLIPSASDGESTVFYHKMKGDYYRYLAEFKAGDEKQNAAEESKKAYETATTVARAKLPPTHILRLSVALSFSILSYQILNTPEAAFRLAKIALDEGVAEINSLKDKAYVDCVSVLCLIRENCTVWTSQLRA